MLSVHENLILGNGVSWLVCRQVYICVFIHAYVCMYMYIHMYKHHPRAQLPAALTRELGEPGLAEGAVHVAVLCGSC